jgi:dihydrofolate reductase
MEVILIAAVSEDGFISTGRGVPWHLPDDVAQFRALTAGRWLLVGRRTYSEMEGWFKPDHTPLVLTRSPEWKPSAGFACASVADALSIAQGKTEQLWVIGGGEVYRAAMPYATGVVMTSVHTHLGAGVPFPTLDTAQWLETGRTCHPADECHALAFSVIRYNTSTLRRIATEPINSAHPT